MAFKHEKIIFTFPFQIGDLVYMIPGHCDPTVNLHDWLIGIEDGVVKEMWPISGRGPGV